MHIHMQASGRGLSRHATTSDLCTFPENSMFQPSCRPDVSSVLPGYPNFEGVSLHFARHPPCLNQVASLRCRLNVLDLPPPKVGRVDSALRAELETHKRMIIQRNTTDIWTYDGIRLGSDDDRRSRSRQRGRHGAEYDELEYGSKE